MVVYFDFNGFINLIILELLLLNILSLWLPTGGCCISSNFDVVISSNLFNCP